MLWKKFKTLKSKLNRIKYDWCVFFLTKVKKQSLFGVGRMTLANAVLKYFLVAKKKRPNKRNIARRMINSMANNVKD